MLLFAVVLDDMAQEYFADPTSAPKHLKVRIGKDGSAHIDWERYYGIARGTSELTEYTENVEVSPYPPDAIIFGGN